MGQYNVKINKKFTYNTDADQSDSIDPNLHLFVFVEHEDGTQGTTICTVKFDMYQNFYG